MSDGTTYMEILTNEILASLRKINDIDRARGGGRPPGSWLKDIATECGERIIRDLPDGFAEKELVKAQSQLQTVTAERDRFRGAIEETINNWDGTDDGKMYRILQAALKGDA